MNVAEKFGDKSALSVDFKPTILYALAAPSTPEAVRAEVIERAESGERISLAGGTHRRHPNSLPMKPGNPSAGTAGAAVSDPSGW
jgi:hypothetical protein